MYRNERFCKRPGGTQQGIGVYFLIVKISLSAQKFSRKTNHEGDEGAQRRYETMGIAVNFQSGLL
jgi:hypothetical protein